MNGPRWIKQWIGELAILNEQFRDEDGSVDFEALGREEYAFRVALITGHTNKSERARSALELAEKAYRASVENGKKGGRPAKNPEENTAETAALDSQGRTGDGSVRGIRRIESPVRPFRFRNKEEFINWAADSGLDLVDAGECWDATVERGWKDADGKPVNNIKAFASQWCATREEKRNKRRSA